MAKRNYDTAIPEIAGVGADASAFQEAAVIGATSDGDPLGALLHAAVSHWFTAAGIALDPLFPLAPLLYLTLDILTAEAQNPPGVRALALTVPGGPHPEIAIRRTLEHLATLGLVFHYEDRNSYYPTAKLLAWEAEVSVIPETYWSTPRLTDGSTTYQTHQHLSRASEVCRRFRASVKEGATKIPFSPSFPLQGFIAYPNLPPNNADNPNPASASNRIPRALPPKPVPPPLLPPEEQAPAAPDAQPVSQPRDPGGDPSPWGPARTASAQRTALDSWTDPERALRASKHADTDNKLRARCLQAHNDLTRILAAKVRAETPSASPYRDGARIEALVYDRAILCLIQNRRRPAPTPAVLALIEKVVALCADAEAVEDAREEWVSSRDSNYTRPALARNQESRAAPPADTAPQHPPESSGGRAPVSPSDG